MTAKEIYESLDLTQLPDAFVEKVKKVEQATKGFTIQSDKVDAFMKGAYDKIKKDKPTALKNLKVEEKVVKKEIKTAKATKVVEDLEYKIRGKKTVTKKTPTPSAPKRKENTNAEAKRTKKKGETFKEAVARVQKEREAAAKEAEKVVSKTAQALKNLEDLLANDPKLAGYPRTYGKQSKNIDASKDSKIKARPAGKRVSKKGHKNQYGPSKGGRVYWENRDNRSDRFAPDFPDKIYLEMGGETDDLGFPTGHTYLVIEVSPSGDKKLIKSTKDYMTALMSSAVARGMKSSKDARVVIVDKEDKKVIHESFEAGGEIVITPTSLINNPDYLVGTTTMTELFECGGVTAYQEGGEVFVTPSSLLNAGSGDYVAGSNTMSNMFAKGGQLDWLDNQEEVEVKIGSKTILFDVLEFDDVYVFDPATEQDEDKVDGLMERNENAVVDGLLRFLRKNVKGVAFSHDENHGGRGFAFKTDEKFAKGGFIAMYNGKKADIEADTLLEAKKKAIEKLNVPKSKQGLLSVVPNSFMENEDFRFMAKGGMVNLYYGGEQEDETLPASSEKDAANIAMRNGAEHYEFVPRMAKGGKLDKDRFVTPESLIDSYRGMNMSDEEILEYARYVVEIQKNQSEASDNPKMKKIELRKAKPYEGVVEILSRNKFAKGGKLPKNIKYYGVNEIKEYRLKNGDKIDPSKTFVDSGVYVSATKTMKPKEEEFQQKLEFKKGGATNWKGEKINWKEDYIYIPRFEVEEVELENGKVIKGDYVISGLYLPKSDRTKLLEKEMKSRMKKMEAGGYVVVGDKDGFWSVVSTPVSKAKAEELLKDTTFPKGEKGKIVSVAEAMSHKKVIGKEYLESGGTIVAADPSAAMEDLNQTYGYESVFEKGGTTPESIQRMQEKLINDLWDRKGYDISYLEELPLNQLKSLYDTEFYYEDEFFEKGGRLGFDGLAKKVAKRYEGQKVPSKFRKEYGKTYSKEEAMEVGRKVAAKVYGQQQANMKKMADGGSLDFEVSEKMAEMAFGSEAYNAILMGLQQSMKGGRALSSVQAKKLADEFASMAVAEKKAKYSDFNSFPVSFAKGGSLEVHGLKDGDVIINTSEEFIKVLDKDGVPFFVNLADGYRGKEKSLPFAEGGKLKSVNIPEIAKKFGKSTSEVFEQIQIGEKHEMEHTKDPKKARKIALDHLSDDMDYYKKLKKLGL